MNKRKYFMLPLMMCVVMVAQICGGGIRVVDASVGNNTNNESAKTTIEDYVGNVVQYADMQLYQEGDLPVLQEEYCEVQKYDESGIALQNTETLGVEEAIYTGMLNGQDTIDISSYGITADQLGVYVQNIANMSPELFYVEAGYGYSASGGKVTVLRPQYKVTGATLQSQKAFYEQELSAIVKQVQKSWSDLEKIVFVHDYLAQNYEYDLTYTNYDAYSFFSEKKGVCQCYTLVFIAVMERLGIEVSTAVSGKEAMNHIWNLVKLDGKWYHVDNTWDDPTADRYGMAMHNNLLLSDTAIGTVRGGSGKYHYAWTASYTCTDTTYDSSEYFWCDSTTPFQYLDNKWYYGAFDDEEKKAKLYSYDYNQKQSSEVAEIGIWKANGGNSYYTSCYSGLDVYNNTLYYNDSSAIYTYTPMTGTNELYTPDIDASIFGMRVDDNYLNYMVAQEPGGTGTIYTYTLEKVESSEEPEESVAPQESEEPEVSEEPQESEEPEESVAPQESEEPEVSEEPQESEEPEVSEEPQESEEPEESVAPQESEEPEESVAPQESEEPEESVAPQESEEPEVSEEPQESEEPQPGESPKPGDEEPQPGESPKPGDEEPQPGESPKPGDDESSTGSRKAGDADGNGTVELKDAQLALRMALLLVSDSKPEDTIAADVDQNGTVELKDAQQILRFALLLTDKFEVVKK